jgi:hypothetical protein
MAGATSVPPLLSMRRSGQSGTKAMAAAWTVVYSDLSSSNIAYLFGGAKINLSTMQAGDHIDLRIRKIVLSGGAWVNHDQLGYDNAQPADHPSVAIGSIPDVFGIEIAMRQTAGTLTTIETEFYAAKVLGTS